MDTSRLNRAVRDAGLAAVGLVKTTPEYAACLAALGTTLIGIARGVCPDGIAAADPLRAPLEDEVAAAFDAHMRKNARTPTAAPGSPPRSTGAGES